MQYILALDAGTTSVRAMLYDLGAKKFVFTAQQEVAQSYPHLGWVEQDASEIYYKCALVLNNCLNWAKEGEVLGIGITNQRESVVFWDKDTGEPVCPAIIWQCRRTSEFCEKIGKEDRAWIKGLTGLEVDAYFSASKVKWGIDNIPAVQALLKRGKLCVGTVDTYLIYKLTEGKSFVTDHTNASRTMLYNLKTLDWEEDLLKYFNVPREILPEIRSCTDVMGEFVRGNQTIPIAGVAGDQQSALFGQACLKKGDGKITYGTGLFMLFHTGDKIARSECGLISTVAYSIGKKVCYALEGSVFNAGSCIQWLRDEMGFIQTSAESEQIALSVPDSGGVTFVPAFTGLGAPYWRGDARALLCGMTRGTTKAHIVRAVLESIAFSARELADCMQRESGISLNEIRCDGGMSANDFLMQLQSDVLGVAINRPVERESTALGVALLCAIALGYVREEEIGAFRTPERVFCPQSEEIRNKAEKGYQTYRFAVKRALYSQ